MNTNVCVTMPWRAQPDRLKAYKRVRNFWQHHGFPVVTADGPAGKPFNLCKARNNAVKKTVADRIIVADADTIPDIGAVYKALENDGVTWPFARYRHIPGSHVNDTDLMTVPIDREYLGSVGGLFICERELYWKLGGMDEKFESCWGYEDNAFYLVARTLSEARREEGVVFSFNHSADRDMSEDNPNRHRYALYKAADGQPKVMRELIK